MLLSCPTFKQALPHFLGLIAKPGAVGEIQREAGFRQRVLRLPVVHLQRGGAVHGAENLEGREENVVLCYSSHSISSIGKCNGYGSLSEDLNLIKCESFLHVSIIS